jgi:hypothetical protein
MPARSPPTSKSIPAWNYCPAPGTARTIKPAERIWAALKNYVANTAVSRPGRLRQIHSFFRSRSPDQMLATTAPWTSLWRYEQNLLECR